MTASKQKQNKPIFRIYSYDFQGNGFIENLIIQDIETLLTHKAKIESLVQDIDMLSKFRLRDIITIAYMAGQQEVLQEKAWLQQQQKKTHRG